MNGFVSSNPINACDWYSEVLLADLFPVPADSLDDREPTTEALIVSFEGWGCTRRAGPSSGSIKDDMAGASREQSRAFTLLTRDENWGNQGRDARFGLSYRSDHEPAWKTGRGVLVLLQEARYDSVNQLLM
jgi:hypothetical protein